MSKVITLMLIALAALYWAQTQKLKSIAIRAARHRCRQAGVQFLDHTVVHSRKRLLKDKLGKWRLSREYTFEFTSTGEARFQGKVILLGKQLHSLELETFPIN
ncbi:DUF3301 domain-containing protein [Aliikangiella sp. G2MR2-5]|uniref:DUF3301 domain-containing protein n=1 Tax=Aliikangiella sp. G2MR2-5 TaxID=2788943 RepID=UPI0018AABD9B|nr:DUF3301 domain-containing protein [Aliikangiella sp. G2MR2-5]